MAQDHHFADVFPHATEAQWRALVERVLKGAPFDRLISRTADEIAIQPLYPPVKEERPRALRQIPGPWRVAARVEHPDAEAARAQIVADLAGGADALHLVFRGSIGANGLGLSGEAGALATMLADVDLDAGLSIELDLGSVSKTAALDLARLIEDRHVDPRRNAISFGIDPLGQMALTGGAPMPWEAFAPVVAQECRSLATRGFAGRFLAADGRLVHAAGGSEGQELAFALGAAIAYIRALEAGGIGLDAARDMISFRLAADADLFATVGKLRALRGLWARVEEACGLVPRPLHLHVETAWRMLTRRDPWVNLLRGTMACLAAGVGGADVVSVQAFSQALGLPDSFARRIARNSQTILIAESGLGRVADPAAGAGGFEALTEQIGAAAWALFQDMERAGGLAAQLAGGAFQARVRETAAARANRVARGTLPLTGTSAFPSLSELPVDVAGPLDAAEPLLDWPIEMTALVAQRDAAPFEAVRDRSDARLAASGRRPRIFLATLGTASDFTARAMFARSLFESGGIEAVGGEASMADEDLAAAFTASGAAIACLCSSDAIYADRAVSSAKVLQRAGARRIWLAGRPGTSQAEWNAAGLEDFIFAGCDAIAVLTLAQNVASA